jgi:hypothetical protein
MLYNFSWQIYFYCFIILKFRSQYCHWHVAECMCYRKKLFHEFNFICIKWLTAHVFQVNIVNYVWYITPYSQRLALTNVSQANTSLNDHMFCIMIGFTNYQERQIFGQWNYFLWHHLRPNYVVSGQYSKLFEHKIIIVLGLLYKYQLFRLHIVELNEITQF